MSNAETNLNAGRVIDIKLSRMTNLYISLPEFGETEREKKRER